MDTDVEHPRESKFQPVKISNAQIRVPHMQDRDTADNDNRLVAVRNGSCPLGGAQPKLVTAHNKQAVSVTKEIVDYSDKTLRDKGDEMPRHPSEHTGSSLLNQLLSIKPVQDKTSSVVETDSSGLHVPVAAWRSQKRSRKTCRPIKRAHQANSAPEPNGADNGSPKRVSQEMGDDLIHISRLSCSQGLQEEQVNFDKDRGCASSKDLIKPTPVIPAVNSNRTDHPRTRVDYTGLEHNSVADSSI